MFCNAASFNSDLSQWTPDKATRMDEMFAHASCFNSDLSNWRTTKVFSMTGMFEGAASLEQRPHWYREGNLIPLPTVGRPAPPFLRLP
mmetsp:Transcript_19508/g.41092  ORF Transcript_19508/g.41092 Transcript_19508/m.41092 type:complete len:88 (+) Transcript_19508:3-266(+)